MPKGMSKLITIVSTGIFLTFLSLPIFAVPFTNGDFSSGLANWNDVSFTGSVSESGGMAQLETGSGDDPFSAILVQGDDGFFSFSSPISLAADIEFLNFDASFLSLGIDASESGVSFFTDFLLVALYDANDISGASDLIFDESIDSSLVGINSFSLDVSALAGQAIALSFELSDQDDGFDSRVLLDNIAFTSAMVNIPVPEPSSIALLGIGLIVTGLQIRKHGRKKQQR